MFIEEHLKRIAALLENMVKIFDYQKLIIFTKLMNYFLLLGFNDFNYSKIFVPPEEEQQTHKKTPIDVLVK